MLEFPELCLFTKLIPRLTYIFYNTTNCRATYPINFFLRSFTVFVLYSESGEYVIQVAASCTFLNRSKNYAQWLLKPCVEWFIPKWINLEMAFTFCLKFWRKEKDNSKGLLKSYLRLIYKAVYSANSLIF